MTLAGTPGTRDSARRAGTLRFIGCLFALLLCGPAVAEDEALGEIVEESFFEEVSPPAPSSIAPSYEMARSAVVVVRAYGRSDRLLRTASGTVAGPGIVLTSAAVLDGARRYTISVPGTSPEFVARLAAEDEDLGLSWLEAPGVEGAMPALAAASVDPGQAVAAVFVGPDGDGWAVRTSQGAVGQRVRREDAPVAEFFHHNAFFASPGYGGPVVNECGEVVGLSVPEPSGRVSADEDPSDSVYAVGPLAIADSARVLGISLIVAADVCTPVLERAQSSLAEAQAALEAERAAAEAAAAEAAARAAELEAQAAAEAERADATAAERAAALAEAEEARSAADEALAAADEARTAAEDALAEAEAQAEAAREVAAAQLAEAEAARAQQEEEAALAEERERRTLLIGAVVLVLLIAAAIGYGVMVSRRQQAAQRAADQRLRATEAELAEERQRPEAFSDVLLDGVDDEGRRISVKIAGAQLVDGDVGVRIGRHPDNEAVLNDPSVSRQHAILRVAGGQLYLRSVTDADTLVGGQPLTRQGEVNVANGAELVLGGARLKLLVL